MMMMITIVWVCLGCDYGGGGGCYGWGDGCDDDDLCCGDCDCCGDYGDYGDCDDALSAYETSTNINT